MTSEPMILDESVERALAAALCEESFWDFIREFWDVIVPEKPIWNWHMKYIADTLQRSAERVFQGDPSNHDIVINVPPGSSKSTICSIMFPAWIWVRMPSARCLCGSFAYPLALDLSRKCRNLIESQQYRRYWPEIRLSPDQNTKGHFANTQGGGRYAVGTGGGITGFHGHFVIVDDPLDPQGSHSEADLKAANQWMQETLPTRKVDKAIAPTILIQQRLHEEDPTGKMVEKSNKHSDYKIKWICLPAKKSIRVRPRALARRYRGGLLDPIRMPESVLRKMEIELGPWAYAGQFDQSPRPLAGGLFHVDKIQVVTHINERKLIKVVRYWDKAATPEGGAFTVGVKLGKLQSGHFLTMDVVRGQWDAFRREEIIKSVADEDGKDIPILVEQEPGSGGKESAQATIRNLPGWVVSADRPTGDKFKRADPVAGQVNGGMWMVLKAFWNDDYLTELRNFGPTAKHKDQVDATSGGFAYLVGGRKRVGTLW